MADVNLGEKATLDRLVGSTTSQESKVRFQTAFGQADLEKADVSYPASKPLLGVWKARGLSYFGSLRATLKDLSHSEHGRRCLLFVFLISLCSTYVAFHLSPTYTGGGGRHISILGAAIVWAVSLCVGTQMVGLGRASNTFSLYEMLALAGISAALAAVLETAFVAGLLLYRIGRYIVALQALSSFALLVVMQYFIAQYGRKNPKRVLIFSPRGDVSAFLSSQLDRARGYLSVGHIDAKAINGDLDLVKACRRNAVKELIYCSGDASSLLACRSVSEALKSGIQVSTGWRFTERVLRETPQDLLDADWPILALADALHDPYRAFRNTVDLLAAIILGVALIPVWLGTAFAIRVRLGKPVMFRQPRTGLGGRIFQIFKFRTLKTDDEREQLESFTQNGDPRLTLLGRILRRTRIDELPQLLNILKGDMVLIGPRPEQPGFVAEYERELPFYSYRHLVKPGITGWAQVRYRYTDDLEGTRRKLGYDLYYLRHMSPKLDIEIALRTIAFLMRGAV